MMVRFPLTRWLVFPGLALLLFIPAVQAQKLSDGNEALKEASYRQPTRQLLKDLFKGNEQANRDDKNHMQAIEVAAKLVTYKVVVDHQDGKPGEMEKTFQGLVSDLTSIAKYKPASQPLAEIYRDKVRTCALDVLKYQNSKPVHRLYAVRVMARVAELGQPELADSLVEVLKDDKQSPAVHYYALKGLRSLLALPAQMPPLLNDKRMQACTQAIIDFLDRKPPVSAGATEEEINGYCMLRREGVRALAEVHSPAVGKARPALVLARFAAADERIAPRVRIDEQIEAAIGLARMHPGDKSSYQADYAAGQIGRALAAFAGKHRDQKEKPGPKRMYPWKHLAMRFAEALTALQETSGKDKYVASVISKGQRVLRLIERNDAVPPGDAGWFTEGANEPSSKELFKGDAESVVKPGTVEELKE